MKITKIDYSIELSPAADCFRADEKFKQNNKIVPLGYSEAEMRWSDGFSDGYRYRMMEEKQTNTLVCDLYELIEKVRDGRISRVDFVAMVEMKVKGLL